VRLPLSQNCLKYYFKPFSSIAADRSGPCSIWAGERSGFGMLPKNLGRHRRFDQIEP
jgi:hypothetical protein